jgi:aldose 1-epimerase
MSYEHIIEHRDGIAFHRLINCATRESVALIPALGGTVSSLRLLAPDEPEELLAFDRPADIRTNPLFRGRFLFPFNDRIPGARYTFNGVTHQLPINSPDDGSAIHGFLHSMEMHIVGIDTTTDAISMTLRARILPGDFAGYPFSIEIEITFILNEKGLQIRFWINNPGSTPCPFALGWHPYFLRGNGAAILHADCERVVEVDADLLPTRRLLPVQHTDWTFRPGRDLRDLSIDLGFTAPADGTMILEREKTAVEIRQDPSLFSYTQLYTPPDAQSIAIEPITAATNSFNLPELGLRVLAPGASVSGDISICCIPPAFKDELF